MRILAAAALLALTACGLEGRDTEKEEERTAAAPADSGPGYDTFGEDNYADSMASHDGSAADAIADPEERPVMQAQVVLDRLGFGPGVIDGKMGMSTENALRGFQMANDLDVTGKLDAATEEALARWDNLPATRVVTIPERWGEAEYVAVPEDREKQAEMERLGYASLDERLAERFHTTVAVLERLNPGGRPAGAPPPSETTTVNGDTNIAQRRARTPSPTANSGASSPEPGPESTFRAGQRIRVPNIGGDRIEPGAIDNPTWQRTLASLGVGSEQPEVERVVVSKSEGTLMAYDGEGELVALFTVTSGSRRDPLPLGEWKVLGVARNPPFAFDPALFWDVPDDEEKLKLPPGPNGPVGVVWIDISKEHYGIHGTPEPQTIGRAQSHGCVRLTNWNAARLAQMVSPGTQVVFEA